MVDPAGVRRAIESSKRIQFAPEEYFFLALGSKGRDESISGHAFQSGVQGLDRFMLERQEVYQHIAGALLPIVERIDPALVPEVFWRDVASRLIFGNPRTLQAYSPSHLIMRLGWYDREVAAALFEPSLARMDQSSGGDWAHGTMEFQAWSIFDPRAAVARLETLAIDPQLPNNAIQARLAVAKSLAQTYEQRWRAIWKDWDIVLGGPSRDF
jgi:hypothetical protein